MVPQSKRRAFLRWWEASVLWSRTAFTFKYAQLELLIWFRTFARGPAFAAASHDLKHPLEVGEESSPVGPTHRRSLQCWLVPHAHYRVLHHSMAAPQGGCACCWGRWGQCCLQPSSSVICSFGLPHGWASRPHGCCESCRLAGELLRVGLVLVACQSWLLVNAPAPCLVGELVAALAASCWLRSASCAADGLWAIRHAAGRGQGGCSAKAWLWS